MRLTTQTDYALRTLMYLTTLSGRAQIAEVAGLFGISVHHIAKVVHLLAKAGYIRSVRGVGGGIELARRPEDIRLGEVVAHFEGGLRLLECVDTENVCAIQSFCKLKKTLAGAEQALLDYLNGVTLADVAPTPRQLKPLES